jgi:DHA1 family multidrug resistance protein-like MFS transporter
VFSLLQLLGQSQQKNKVLSRFGLIILFYALADGIASFALPVYMEQSLQDLALVGLIFGSSSIFGAVGSLFFGFEQKGRTFKPYFLSAMVMAAAAYLLALKVQSWSGFLVIMALWGFYYEGINFSWMDFLGRYTQKAEHSGGAGIVQMFNALGYLLGPLLAGWLILRGRWAMAPALLFLFLSWLLFLAFFGRKKIAPDVPQRKLRLLTELKTWIRVGRRSFWVVLANFLQTALWESLIWSMGPILLTRTLGSKSALVMALFLIPSVFLRGFSGRWADRKGKKEFVILGLVMAGLFLSLFGLFNSLLLKSLTAFLSACGVCLFWPAADGLFIDLVDGYSKDNEEEVAGVRGLAHNLGYVVGPMIAGFLGQALGLNITFIVYGAFLILGAGMIKGFWKK